MSDASSEKGHATHDSSGKTAEKSLDRYEFGEFFSREGEDTQHFLKVCGVVLVFVILAVLIGWPLRYWPGESAPIQAADAGANSSADE